MDSLENVPHQVTSVFVSLLTGRLCSALVSIMSSTEASEIACEIVSELLDRVCSPPTSPVNTVKVQQPPSFDICLLSRELCEVINAYSLRAPGVRVEVYQIKGLDQKASGYCGHYALYFSLSLIHLCSSHSHDDAQLAISLLTHRESFWRRYWESIGQLLTQVNEESWWPWTREHVCAGEIERSYLRYLLHTQLAHIVKDRVFVLQYAYGLLQDSLEHIGVVQEAINWFVNEQSVFLVFILGVTDHWVTLLAYRESSDRIRLLYLDSNNEPVLMASEADIDQLVTIREKKHFERKGVGYEKWKRNTLCQSLYDQRDVVAMLTECLRGQHTLPCEFVSRHWERMLSNYNKTVADATNDGDMYIVKLICWLESGYSVKGLRDAYVGPLLHFGLESLNTKLKSEVKCWVEQCALLQPVGGLEQITEFIESVGMLNSLFDVHV